MSMQPKILVIEDEIRLSNAVCKYIENEGYEFLQATSGSLGLDLHNKYQPSLVVLDIMLPDMDGLEVCRHIRKSASTPILFLTARVDDQDRLKGFELGGDDYLCKPFNPLELMARIKAILRRFQSDLEANALQVGEVQLFAEDHRATIYGKNIELTQSEFNILKILMSQPDKAFSRHDLLVGAHGKYAEFYERTIDTHIKNLRKKINIEKNTRYIRTVYGIGYKFRG